MEKLTISRIGEPKIINFTNKKTGQPDSFQKVGIQVNEYPERWFDFTFRGQHGLSIGQSYEFETASREYNGKTYWDAKLPKGAARGGGMSEADKLQIRRADQNATEALRRINEIHRRLDLAKVPDFTSDGQPVPDFESTEEPPIESYEQP